MNWHFLKYIISKLGFSGSINKTSRLKLIHAINKAGFPENEVAVDFSIFFENNTDTGSIAPNSEPIITPFEIFQELKKLKGDRRTKEIMVRIADIEENCWPYSDAIYITGTWTPRDLKMMCKKIRPDSIVPGWMYEKPANFISSGDNVITLWWD